MKITIESTNDQVTITEVDGGSESDVISALAVALAIKANAMFKHKIVAQTLLDGALIMSKTALDDLYTNSDENKFADLVTCNLNDPKVKDFANRFIGRNVDEKHLDVKQCLVDTYEQTPIEELIDFQKELKELVK